MVPFLLCSFSDYALYLYQVLKKYLNSFSKLLSRHYFQTEIFKVHNSLKNVGRVMVLNLCTLSYDAFYLVYICSKFHENILVGIKVIEQTQFS